MRFVNKTNIFAISVGLIFLFSGIGKSLAISDFVQLYSLVRFEFLTLGVVWIEILIGVALILRIYLKSLSVISGCFLILVTIVYLYGYFAHGITDCGCFGVIASSKKISPYFVISRNLLLMAMLYVVWKKTDNQKYVFNLWVVLFIAGIFSVLSFFSGYTYKPSSVALYDINEKFQGKAISETPLDKLITTSVDSTYLIFVFSYTCPHCLNSIENLKQYEKTKEIDKVIGLAVNDTIHETVFRNNFYPEFAIKNCNTQDITQLTDYLPSAFYVKNDTIKMELKGELPCTYNFIGLLTDLSDKK